MKSVLFALLAAAWADYTPKGSVVILTDKNFKSEVMESDDLWMVEFYAPWCGHCKNLEPAWKKAAKATKGIAKFGAVDATVHQSLAQKYGVRGYPTIKVFGKNKKKPEDYNGGRGMDDLKNYAISAAKKLDPSKKAAPDADAGDKKEKKEKKEKKTPPPADDHGYGKDVVMLTDTTFDKTVKGAKQVVFVKFMAPWCGHCKSMVGDLSDAATKVKGDAIVAAVDATANQHLASKYGVKGFPTLIAFMPDGTNTKYEGQRSAGAIVDFIREKAAEFAGPVEVPQVTSPEQFDEDCRATSKQACIVAVLPHVADGGAAKRNKYLNLLNTLATKHRKYTFVWTAVGEQNALAENLGASVYPSIAAVNFGKGKYGKFTQAFDEKHLDTWLSKPLSANAKISNPEMSIKDTDPWDGKDYVPPVEEEM